MAIKFPFHIVTLGCEKNLADAEFMRAALEAQGGLWVDDPDEAEAVFVNTCAFIEPARAEADEIIRAFLEARQYDDLKVFITGCLPQYLGVGIKKLYPRADGFLGPGNPALAPELLKTPKPAILLPLIENGGKSCPEPGARSPITPPWRAFLKLGDGCDNNCAYCVIGRLRGRFRSRPLPDLLEEARLLAHSGVRELTLVSQDTTRWGEDLGGGENIRSLLEALLGIEDLRWVRMLYLHPRRLERDLIRFMASQERLCSYFDLPIQHIDDSILQRMGRGYDSNKVKELLNLVYESDPDAAVRTSLIVGFPGEGDREFERLRDFVAQGWFNMAGIFGFSAEPGTRAAELDGQAPPEVIIDRLNHLNLVQEQAAEDRNSRRIGNTYEVLVEDSFEDDPESDAQSLGRIFAQAPDMDGVTFLSGDHRPGTFIRARVTAAVLNDLEAEPC